MHCDRARAALLARLDRPGEADPELDTHLTDCADCAALLHDLTTVQAQARVWHELSPPPWNPAAGAWQRSGWGPAFAEAGGWRPWLQQWLPLAASTAALLLAAGLFWRGTTAADADWPVVAPAVAEAPVHELLAASRQEREQEMEALTALLKAEMDRRSLETEESLKYIISHQIQSQRQLDALRSALSDTTPAGERL